MHTAPRLLFISSASRWAFSGFWITERLRKYPASLCNGVDESDRAYPEQRAALHSFVYNVGAGNFRTSTLLRKIKPGGDIMGACDRLRRWAYAGGKQWKGLMTRREIEREVCLWGQQ